MKKVYIYSKYNRFWHWTQASLILFQALTGFEIHGTYHLFGYETATYLHKNTGWALVILTVFTIFWSFTTGEWKQYVRSFKHLKEQINYYVSGIFKNEPHPVHKTRFSKFNPLQRMTYLGLLTIIIPTMIITGLMYDYYFDLSSANHIGLTWIAYIHTLGAFLLLGFVIAHVYLTTTGHTIFAAIKAMITGWEIMSDEEAEYAVKEDLRAKIKEVEDDIISTDENKDELIKEALKEVEG